jgi:hypothetical protein
MLTLTDADIVNIWFFYYIYIDPPHVDSGHLRRQSRIVLPCRRNLHYSHVRGSLWPPDPALGITSLSRRAAMKPPAIKPYGAA